MGGLPAVFASDVQSRIGTDDDLAFEELIRFCGIETDDIRRVVVIEVVEIELMDLGSLTMAMEISPSVQP